MVIERGLIGYNRRVVEITPDMSDIAPAYQEMGLEIRYRGYHLTERIGRLLRNPIHEIRVTYQKLNLKPPKSPQLLRRPSFHLIRLLH